MAITRPLGEVNLTAMNRCVGVYKVYLNGGGGGGGGFDDFYLWYGGAGNFGVEDSYTVKLVPPISLSVGAGGSAGVAPAANGGQGGTTSMIDSRLSSIASPGGDGGTSATTEKSLHPATAATRFGKVYSRFTVDFSYGSPSPPYFAVTTGLGGDSLSSGLPGGIIKAFRIG